MTQALAKRRNARAVLNGRPVHRFSVDDFQRVIDAGILTTRDKVERLDGWIVDKMPQNPARSSAVTYFDDWLGGPVTGGLDRPCTTAGDASDKRTGAGHSGRTRSEITVQESAPGPLDIALLIEIAKKVVTMDDTPKLMLDGKTYGALKLKQLIG